MSAAAAGQRLDDRLRQCHDQPQSIRTGHRPRRAGQYVVFARAFVRLPSELQTTAARRELRDDFVSGSADDRMHDLDLMGSFVAGMDKETDATIRNSAELYIDYITKVRRHAGSGGMAGYLAATLPGIPGRATQLTKCSVPPPGRRV